MKGINIREKVNSRVKFESNQIRLFTVAKQNQSSLILEKSENRYEENKVSQ
jgi:hypothetical protein